MATLAERVAKLEEFREALKEELRELRPVIRQLKELQGELEHDRQEDTIRRRKGRRP